MSFKRCGWVLTKSFGDVMLVAHLGNLLIITSRFEFLERARMQVVWLDSSLETQLLAFFSEARRTSQIWVN